MTDFETRRRMMVDTQVRPSDVTKYPVLDALLEVRREMYVPDALRDVAYMDNSITLGENRIVLEARTFSKILDTLDIQQDEMALDIGCGLGYSAAVLGKLCEAVVAVEEDETLASEAEAILGSEGADNVAVVGGALTEGAAKHGPYDVIILEGAVEEMPEALTDQLKEGGRIAAVFMDGALGMVRVGLKTGGTISWRFAFNATAPVLPGFSKAASFAL
ncbi:MAG: protein-L-isoaspartate O-methyltransferase [Dinoroseobacter sp.]|nr:protein-L-isoaspartate O-methyltransferase [Dinoroseobacter sp.]